MASRRSTTDSFILLVGFQMFLSDSWYIVRNVLNLDISPRHRLWYMFYVQYNDHNQFRNMQISRWTQIRWPIAVFLRPHLPHSSSPHSNSFLHNRETTLRLLQFFWLEDDIKHSSVKRTLVFLLDTYLQTDQCDVRHEQA
jgi:hypothetical protein